MSRRWHGGGGALLPGVGVPWGYIQERHVPKVSVYLPDELYRRAREEGLKLSRLTRAAVEEALGGRPNDRWLDEVAARPRRLRETVDTSQLLADARDEFGT